MSISTRSRARRELSRPLPLSHQSTVGLEPCFPFFSLPVPVLSHSEKRPDRASQPLGHNSTIRVAFPGVSVQQGLSISVFFSLFFKISRLSGSRPRSAAALGGRGHTPPAYAAPGRLSAVWKVTLPRKLGRSLGNPAMRGVCAGARVLVYTIARIVSRKFHVSQSEGQRVSEGLCGRLQVRAYGLGPTEPW